MVLAISLISVVVFNVTEWTNDWYHWFKSLHRYDLCHTRTCPHVQSALRHVTIRIDLCVHATAAAVAIVQLLKRLTAEKSSTRSSSRSGYDDRDLQQRLVIAQQAFLRERHRCTDNDNVEKWQNDRIILLSVPKMGRIRGVPPSSFLKICTQPSAMVAIVSSRRRCKRPERTTTTTTTTTVTNHLWVVSFPGSAVYKSTVGSMSFRSVSQQCLFLLLCGNQVNEKDIMENCVWAAFNGDPLVCPQADQSTAQLALVQASDWLTVR